MSTLKKVQSMQWGAIATNAAFQAWGMNVASALAACFANTGDSGQINWNGGGTFAWANGWAGTQMVGYETYKFQDFYQTNGAPVSFKVTYGVFNNGGSPQIWIIFGSGTNGTGNTTGNGITQTGTGVASGNSTGGGNGFAVFNSFTTGANVLSILCGDSNTGNGDSRIVCGFNCMDNAYGIIGNTGGLYRSNTSAYQLFSIERSKDANGTPTSDGIMFVAMQGSTSVSYGQVYIPCSTFSPPLSNSSVFSRETSLGYLLSDQPFAGSLTSGMPYGQISPEQYPFSPLFLLKAPGVFAVPGLNLLVGWEGVGGITFNHLTVVSGQPLTPIPITVSGQTHYYVTGGSQTFSGITNRSAGNPGMATNNVLFFRYE
jgi:hypothetical protein